jgi:hypothetical protein
MVESPELLDFSCFIMESVYVGTGAFSLLATYSQIEKLKIGSAKIKCFFLEIFNSQNLTKSSYEWSPLWLHHKIDKEKDIGRGIM